LCFRVTIESGSRFGVKEFGLFLAFVRELPSSKRRLLFHSELAMYQYPPESSQLVAQGGGTFCSDGGWVEAVGGGAVAVSDESIVSEASGLFTLVVRVAIANMLFNALRPDPMVSWSLRLPRVLWELSIATVARGARQRPTSSSRRSRRGRRATKTQEGAAKANEDTSSPSPATADTASRMSSVLSMSPSRFLLLAFMLITTALTDIFVWAPIFAAMINFKTCTGGWLTGEPHRCRVDLSKGYGRAFVVAQCIVGGIVYLLTGISAYNVYSTQQQRQVLARHVALQHQRWQQQQQQAEKDRVRHLVEEEQKRRELERLRREEAKKEQADASSFWSAPSFWPGL
jgi:hypothetical protein